MCVRANTHRYIQHTFLTTALTSSVKVFSRVVVTASIAAGEEVSVWGWSWVYWSWASVASPPNAPCTQLVSEAKHAQTREGARGQHTPGS